MLPLDLSSHASSAHHHPLQITSGVQLLSAQAAVCSRPHRGLAESFLHVQAHACKVNGSTCEVPITQNRYSRFSCSSSINHKQCKWHSPIVRHTTEESTIPQEVLQLRTRSRSYLDTWLTTASQSSNSSRSPLLPSATVRTALLPDSPPSAGAAGAEADTTRGRLVEWTPLTL